MKIRICDICGKEIKRNEDYSHFKFKETVCTGSEIYTQFSKCDICCSCLDIIVSQVRANKT